VEEGSPILETALIAYELRPVLLSHEGYPISVTQCIHALGSEDGIEGGSVHMQAIGVLNESELLEPIHKETHS